MLLTLPKVFPLIGLPAEYGLAVCQAASDLLSFLFLALPLAIHMFRKLAPLADGDEPPFKTAANRVGARN
jgi:hypothetical protein